MKTLAGATNFRQAAAEEVSLERRWRIRHGEGLFVIPNVRRAILLDHSNQHTDAVGRVQVKAIS